VSHSLFHVIRFAELSQVDFAAEPNSYRLLFSALFDVDEVAYKLVLIQSSQPVVVLCWHMDDELIAALGVGDVGDFFYRNFALDLGPGEKTDHDILKFFVPEVDQPQICQSELSALGPLSFVDFGDESASQYLL
jgi:hypothetical protein